jgi:hypothetical protein
MRAQPKEIQLATKSRQEHAWRVTSLAFLATGGEASSALALLDVRRRQLNALLCIRVGAQGGVTVVALFVGGWRWRWVR